MKKIALVVLTALSAIVAVQSHADPITVNDNSVLRESSIAGAESTWNLTVGNSLFFFGDRGARSARGSSATSSIGDDDAPTFASSSSSSFINCKQSRPSDDESALRGRCSATGFSRASLNYQVNITPRDGVDPTEIFALTSRIPVSIDYVLEATARNDDGGVAFSTATIRLSDVVGATLSTSRLGGAVEELVRTGSFAQEFNPFGGSFSVLLRTATDSNSGNGSLQGRNASSSAFALADPVFRIDPAFADLYDITSTFVPDQSIEQVFEADVPSDPVSVPEPSTITLLGIGLLGLGLARRKSA